MAGCRSVEASLREINAELRNATRFWSKDKFWYATRSWEDKEQDSNLHVMQVLACYYEQQIETIFGRYKIQGLTEVERHELKNGRKNFIQQHFDRLTAGRRCNNVRCTFNDYYYCYVTSERRSGGVIFTKDLQDVLVIVPKRTDERSKRRVRGTTFSFPKGKIQNFYPNGCENRAPPEQNREQRLDAALRVTREQTGITEEQIRRYGHCMNQDVVPRYIVANHYWTEVYLYVYTVDRFSAPDGLIPILTDEMRREVDSAGWLPVQELTTSTRLTREIYGEEIKMYLSTLIRNAWPELQKHSATYYKHNLPDLPCTNKLNEHHQDDGDDEDDIVIWAEYGLKSHRVYRDSKYRPPELQENQSLTDIIGYAVDSMGLPSIPIYRDPRLRSANPQKQQHNVVRPRNNSQSPTRIYQPLRSTEPQENQHSDDDEEVIWALDDNGIPTHRIYRDSRYNCAELQENQSPNDVLGWALDSRGLPSHRIYRDPRLRSANPQKHQENVVRPRNTSQCPNSRHQPLRSTEAQENQQPDEEVIWALDANGIPSHRIYRDSRYNPAELQENQRPTDVLGYVLDANGLPSHRVYRDPRLRSANPQNHQQNVGRPRNNSQSPNRRHQPLRSTETRENQQSEDVVSSTMGARGLPWFLNYRDPRIRSAEPQEHQRNDARPRGRYQYPNWDDPRSRSTDPDENQQNDVRPRSRSQNPTRRDPTLRSSLNNPDENGYRPRSSSQNRSVRWQSIPDGISPRDYRQYDNRAGSSTDKCRSSTEL